METWPIAVSRLGKEVCPLVVHDSRELLIYEGPGPAPGASMMIGKACALAAVYVHDGAPRELARSRRDLKAQLIDADPDAARTDYRLQGMRPSWFAVGDDAIAFWAVDPERARSRRARSAEIHRSKLEPGSD